MRLLDMIEKYKKDTTVQNHSNNQLTEDIAKSSNDIVIPQTTEPSHLYPVVYMKDEKVEKEEIGESPRIDSNTVSSGYRQVKYTDHLNLPRDQRIPPIRTESIASSSRTLPAMYPNTPYAPLQSHDFMDLGNLNFIEKKLQSGNNLRDSNNPTIVNQENNPNFYQMILDYYYGK